MARRFRDVAVCPKCGGVAVATEMTIPEGAWFMKLKLSCLECGHTFERKSEERRVV